MNKSYPTKKLGEIAQFLRGSGLSKKDLTPSGKYKAILYGQLYTIYGPVITEVKSRTNKKGSVLSVAGDVLVPGTTTADEIGIAVASALNEDGVILGGDINIIRTENKILNSKFLAYLLSGPLRMRMAKYARGTNIIHLSGKDIAKIEIPLPPFHIQKQIVERLDKIVEAQKLNDELIKKAEELYRSLLHNELNAKIKNQNAKSQFKIKKLKEIAEYINGRAFKPAEWTNKGLPIIRIQNLAETQEKFNYFDGRLEDKYLVKNGDILLSWSASLGVYIWNKGDAALNQHIFKVIPKNGADKEFLFHTLVVVVEQLKRQVHGSTMTHITKPVFSRVTVVFPPLNIQKQIAAKLSAVQEYKKQLLTQKSKLKELFDSVLSKSFS